MNPAGKSRRWYQFSLARLFALTAVVAVGIAILTHWKPLAIVLIVPLASVIAAAPLGVPLYFIGTMLNDRKQCTPRFLLAFLICEIVALGIVAAAILFSLLFQVLRD